MYVLYFRYFEASARLWQPSRRCGLPEFLQQLIRLPACAIVAAILLSLCVAQARAAGDTIPVQPRIIGGEAAAPGSFPSVMPMLQTFPGVSPFQRQGCGATLIAPTWAITAAHCVVEGNVTVPSSNWTVLPGTTQLSLDDNADRSAEVAVLSIYAHPGFSLATFDDDIALLELAEPINQPVVSLYGGDAADLVGVEAFLVGWGVVDNTDPQNPLFPLEQHFGRVPVVSNEVCNGPNSYAGSIEDTQLCAGLREGGIDSCQGDSGGPLIIGIDGRQVQAGIVSFGRGCALPDLYGVYTSISAYRPWISSFVDVSYLPDQADGSDPGDDPESPSEVTLDPTPADPEPESDGEPVQQSEPAGPDPFSDPVDDDSDNAGSSGGGGGAALWWMALASAVLIGRQQRRRDPA